MFICIYNEVAVGSNNNSFQKNKFLRGQFHKLFCAPRPTFEKLFRGVEHALHRAPNFNRGISMICTMRPTFIKSTPGCKSECVSAHKYFFRNSNCNFYKFDTVSKDCLMYAEGATQCMEVIRTKKTIVDNCPKTRTIPSKTNLVLFYPVTKCVKSARGSACTILL